MSSQLSGPHDDPIDQALLDMATFVPDSQTVPPSDPSFDLFPFPEETPSNTTTGVDDPLGDIF